jgi:hypothetical protein
LSTKRAPSRSWVAAETRAFCSRAVEGEQQTKTKTALEYFARELKSAD